MLRLVVVSALLVAIHGHPSPTTSSQVDVAPRILDGVPAKPGQFPFIASLHDSTDEFQCAGSIIRERWILTTARCLAGQYNITKVIVGTLGPRRGDGQIFGVAEAIPYPTFIPDDQYKPHGVRRDIGLVKVDRPIVFSELVQPIKLGTVNLGEEVITAGWGRGSENALSYLTEITTNMNCDADKEIFICVISPRGTECEGDSGGPLVKDGLLVGHVSYGDTFCLKKEPTKFLKVAVFEDWIQSQLENDDSH